MLFVGDSVMVDAVDFSVCPVFLCWGRMSSCLAGFNRMPSDARNGIPRIAS